MFNCVDTCAGRAGRASTHLHMRLHSYNTYDSGTLSDIQFRLSLISAGASCLGTACKQDIDFFYKSLLEIVWWCTVLQWE